MKLIKKEITLVILAALMPPLAVQGASLEERVAVLEEALLDAEESNEAINLELETAVDISGYADVEYIVEDGNSPTFRMHHLSLFFKKNFGNKWKFFSEIEFEDGPKFEGPSDSGGVLKAENGKIFVEAVNFDYQWRPEAIFRVGRFFTPAGLWSVDHYPPFVPTQERPGHIRKIFPQLVDGAMVYGTLRMGNSFLNYDTYVGNGEDSNGTIDNNSEKALGLKTSLVFPIDGFQHAELGFSVYHDTLNAGLQYDKMATGVHARFRLNEFAFQAEASSASFDEDAGLAKKGDASGYYGQLVYTPNQWSGGFRHDVYNADESAMVEITTNSVFLNYRFSANIVGKVEFHRIDAENAAKKVDKTIFSIVAYLD